MSLKEGTLGSKLVAWEGFEVPKDSEPKGFEGPKDAEPKGFEAPIDVAPYEGVGRATLWGAVAFRLLFESNKQ